MRPRMTSIDRSRVEEAGADSRGLRRAVFALPDMAYPRPDGNDAFARSRIQRGKGSRNRPATAFTCVARDRALLPRHGLS